MKYLGKPQEKAKETYSTCISKVRNPYLKSRLEACKDLVDEAETEFDSLITTGNIYTISAEVIVNGNVSAKELENVYTQRMAKKDKPGRIVYDKLFSLPEFGICPLCGHRQVETLDHYLPKTDFPRLTVTPINLIPACNKCNKSKLTDKPTKPEEETLHPYYDDIEDEEWLFAEVIQVKPPKINFFVNAPSTWSSLLKKRVLYHFKAFYLNDLYAKQAAVFLADINYKLEGIYKEKGSGGVKKYLVGEANSRYMAEKNSWRTAFYKAISDNDWFCEGGFRFK